MRNANIGRIMRFALLLLAPSLMLPALAAAQSTAPPSTTMRPGVATPGGSRRLEDLHPQAIFPVAGTPDWSVVATNSVWVSSARVNHVVQLNAITNTPGLIADVRRPCSGLSAAFGSIWVPSCGDHNLVRLDPETGKPIAVVAADPANSEGGITAGAGSIWIVTKPSRLVRISPESNAITASTDLPAGATNVAFGANAIWVSSYEQDRLLRVDPATMAITDAVSVGPKPRFLTVSDDAVWTLNQGDGSVSRVSLTKPKLVTTIACGIPGQGGEIAFGAGHVWATMFDVPLTEIDPATNTVTRQWKGQGGDGLRFGLGSLWLSNLMQGTVWRLAPDHL